MGQPFDATDRPESVRNIVGRYADIEQHFPEDLDGPALPYFVDWLVENVHLVEITAYSDEDAYTIFETMNDRGLSLTPADMLKGYVLANISDEKKKLDASRTWKTRLGALVEFGKDEDADALKAWLRSQYAQTIRERKKGAVPGDFDRMGTEFDRWVREHHDKIGLSKGSDFVQFVERDLNFYARQYLRLREAARTYTQGLEVIFYKVDVATRALAASSLAVMPFEDTYQQYVREHPSVRVQLAVTALDSNAGRRDVARLLPRRIVNASTTDRIITVSSHGFADGRACLFCVYADRSRAMTREQIVANELGVAADEIERLLAENKPVDSAFVARLEAHKGVAAGTFAELINTPLASFHQRAVCSSAQISTPTGAVVAPLSFISAAAGLLLLTDLLGGVALRDEDARPNYLRIDMLGSPTLADRDIRVPDQGHACICKDVDYVDVYRARYRAA